MTGPTINTGKELEMTKIQSDFYADLNTAEYFSKIEVVGQETFAGEPCYKVAFTTKGGIELFNYFSVATGLMVGTTGNLPTPMGEVFVETETRDHKEFDGVLYPTTSVQKAMGAEQVLTLTEPDFGEIDPARLRAAGGGQDAGRRQAGAVSSATSALGDAADQQRRRRFERGLGRARGDGVERSRHPALAGKAGLRHHDRGEIGREPFLDRLGDELARAGQAP